MLFNAVHLINGNIYSLIFLLVIEIPWKFEIFGFLIFSAKLFKFSILDGGPLLFFLAKTLCRLV